MSRDSQRIRTACEHEGRDGVMLLSAQGHQGHQQSLRNWRGPGPDPPTYPLKVLTAGSWASHLQTAREKASAVRAAPSMGVLPGLGLLRLPGFPPCCKVCDLSYVCEAPFAVEHNMSTDSEKMATGSRGPSFRPFLTTCVC